MQDNINLWHHNVLPIGSKIYPFYIPIKKVKKSQMNLKWGGLAIQAATFIILLVRVPEVPWVKML